MSGVAIISGLPGSGKTTLASRLARRYEHSVHLKADQFIGFITHPVDPYSSESRAQSEALARAIAACAASFAESRYAVFLDGVIGPWNLPIYEARLVEFDYAILDVDGATAINRMCQRGDSNIEQHSIDRLWRFFQKYPDVLSRHRLNAAEDVDAVVTEFETRRAAGELSRRTVLR